MKVKRAPFITFEGPDGAGKSTQIHFTADFFRNKGWEVVSSREPGGTEISEKIRDILLDKANRGMEPITELLLYAASRAQH
ncbi:MAG: dTMP kinase, partial [Lachnospiraceae bacterium]|nr:dTMP kinase [Lachnospiraceae bacterium]